MDRHTKALIEASTQLLDRLDELGNIDHIREEGPIQDLRNAIENVIHPTKDRIAIEFSAGLVQGIYSKIPMEVIVLDIDCDGIDKDELINLYGHDVYPVVHTACIKPKIIDDAFRLFEEGE